MLAEVLEAVGAQLAGGPPAEVVVVDNDPDGSARVQVARCPFARYVHEPWPGIAFARNRGIAAAKGTHILFLDDDEVPATGWLAAFHARAEAGDAACFGPIVPRFLKPPPVGLAGPLRGIFSRAFTGRAGGEITRHRAYLGAGNAMFARAACFGDGLQFDARFNAGGEDVWLLRKLVEDLGLALTWCPEAMVHELVPPSRMTAAFVRDRKFRSGALRCIVERGRGGLASLRRVAFWMGVGLVQVVLFGPPGLVLRALAAARAEPWLARASGGMGKLLWWSDPRA